IPPANTPALPSGFSDIPQSVISCWDAHASYNSASWFLYTQLLSSENYTFSEWSSTSYSFSTYLNARYNCNTTALPSLTTLCDGLKDAYKWRTSFLAQNPSITGSIAGPECTVLNDGIVPAKPACYLEGGTWEAFYWPTVTPTGSAFCNTTGANITGTPTKSGQANTAIISGLTLTSPSVYYMLRNAILQTLTGQASLVGNTNTASKQDVFAPSTTATILTVAQQESDIITISRVCAGSNKRRYCTFHGSPGFSIADLATVRATEYCGWWGCDTSETIYQDEYTPTLGIPVSAIASQNGVFSDCAWTTPGARVRVAGALAYNGGKMGTEDWHPITTLSEDARKSMETGS
ncbi:hypothetical protein DE146DRAFT_601981, partial [Phaeosphaeria sp. MPI-PUGE-AT-0046c]